MKKGSPVLELRTRRAADALDASISKHVENWFAALRSSDMESLYLAMQRMQSAVTIRGEQTFLHNIPSWVGARTVLEVGYGLDEIVGSITPYFSDKKFEQIPFFIDTYRSKSGGHRREYGINKLSAESFPIADGKYDAVLLRWIAQYCTDHRQLLKRMHRAIKLGGSLFIIEPVDAEAKFQPTIPALDDFYQKLNFFQKASGGNRDVVQAILSDQGLPGFELVSSKKDAIPVFSLEDKDAMARMFILIAEFVERSYQIKVDVEALVNGFLSWQFNQSGWGQIVMHYLELKRVA